MTTTYPIALGIAEPGGVWHVETLTLHWDTDDVPDRLALEREAIAAWTASNVRSEAVHVWLMEDDGWDEDDAVTELRERRRRDTLQEPDDLPL